MPAVMPSSRWLALPGRTTSTPLILGAGPSASAKPTPNRHGPLNGVRALPKPRGVAKVILHPANPILSAEASDDLLGGQPFRDGELVRHNAAFDDDGNHFAQAG